MANSLTPVELVDAWARVATGAPGPQLSVRDICLDVLQQDGVTHDHLDHALAIDEAAAVDLIRAERAASGRTPPSEGVLRRLEYRREQARALLHCLVGIDRADRALELIKQGELGKAFDLVGTTTAGFGAVVERWIDRMGAKGFRKFLERLPDTEFHRFTDMAAQHIDPDVSITLRKTLDVADSKAWQRFKAEGETLAKERIRRFRVVTWEPLVDKNESSPTPPQASR